MKNKFKLFLGILILLSVFSVCLVNAAVDVVTPIDGGNYTGSHTFNCTYANGTDTTNPLTANTTFYYNLSASDTEIEYTGFTCSDNACWVTVDTSKLTDGVGYMVSCIVGNLTKETGSDDNSTVIIFDNTAPTISVELIPSKWVEYMYRLKVTSSCTDAIDSSPTFVRNLNKGQVTTNQVSFSSTPYVFTAGDLNILGSNDIVTTCTDFTGNAATTTDTFVIQTEEEIAEEDDEKVVSRKISMGAASIYILIAALFIVIVIAVIYMVTKKKK